MALRAKIRGKVRNVSPAMARVLSRRGIHVHGLEPAAPPLTPDPVGPPAVDDDYEREVIQHMLDLQAQESSVAPPAIRASTFDTSDVPSELTDDELERLTAPES